MMTLRPRLIPCLLLKNGALFKTVNFKDPKYVGDPLNAVKIFNEKEVDELIILDIDASRLKIPPDEDLISKLAAECRMPLCYGGGIKNVDQIERIIGLGVEKVAIGSASFQDTTLIEKAAKRVGAQSIVGVIDVKSIGLFKKKEVFILNGTKKTGLTPEEFAIQLQTMGVGEILLNSIDLDGSMSGYDFELINIIKNVAKVPLTVIGGAGSLNDIKKLFQEHHYIGGGAGSLFVFKGKYRAVLINYPSNSEKDKLIYNSH